MSAVVAATEKEVDLAQWRDLYGLAQRVKTLAPWTFMSEADVFGIEMPGSGQLVFLSVMGAIDEHYAVAIYKGPAAISAFWELQADPHMVAERILEIPQVQLSFESRDQLEPEQRRIVKQLGLSFRGHNSWPVFRSSRPGFVPWSIDADEAGILAVALEQLLHVAPRLRLNRTSVLKDDLTEYLVRFRNRSGGGAWTEEFRTIPRLEAAPPIAPGPEQIRKCRALPAVHNSIEVDFFMMPTGIREGKDRPYYPFIFVLVEAKSGIVAGQKLLSPNGSLEGMFASLPEELLGQLMQIGIRPATVILRPGRLRKILHPVCDDLGIRIHASNRLPKLDEFKRGFLNFR